MTLISHAAARLFIFQLFGGAHFNSAEAVQLMPMPILHLQKKVSFREHVIQCDSMVSLFHYFSSFFHYINTFLDYPY